LDVLKCCDIFSLCHLRGFLDDRLSLSGQKSA
jgi:hypothetical protein